MHILIRSSLITLGLALLIAFVATIIDYRLNPQNLLYDEHGIKWAATSATFFSWLWPGLVLILPIILVVTASFRLFSNAIKKG